jgi:hypothetical protein
MKISYLAENITGKKQAYYDRPPQKLETNFQHSTLRIILSKHRADAWIPRVSCLFCYSRFLSFLSLRHSYVPVFGRNRNSYRIKGRNCLRGKFVSRYVLFIEGILISLHTQRKNLQWRRICMGAKAAQVEYTIAEKGKNDVRILSVERQVRVSVSGTHFYCH